MDGERAKNPVAMCVYRMAAHFSEKPHRHPINIDGDGHPLQGAGKRRHQVRHPSPTGFRARTWQDQTGRKMEHRPMKKTTPTILIDSREQLPLDIQGFPTEVIGLPVGDYGIKGFSDWNNSRFIVERKSLDDLVGSLTQGRERFFKECEKMRQFQTAILLIEGMPNDIELETYRSRAKGSSIQGSIAALQVRANLQVVWGGGHTGAARALERLVRVFVSGVERDYRRLVS
jgi:DNA excision repair protein ERCC-4